MPGYQPVQHCLRAVGVRVVHVPVDEQGLDVSAGRLLEPHARLAYVTPAHQYPLGYEMSLERRKALLDWAVEQESFVLEDDYDGDYRYEGRPIASLQGMDANGRVIYIGSFNKILFPALRIAYAIVPEALVGAFIDAKNVTDGHTALLMQGVLAAFVREGHLARHIRKTRTIYDERRRAFLEEAKVLEDLIDLGPARAGMHVTGSFKDSRTLRLDDRAVAAECARSGIEVHPLSRYGATGRGGLVFGFAVASRAAARSGLQDRAPRDCRYRWSGVMERFAIHVARPGAGREAQRAGEVPVGAVIVKDGAIVGEGWNWPISSNDPTAHAEIVALRDAAQKLQTYRLLDTTLYVTLEPCPMCAGAMVHARVKRLVYAATDPRAGAAGTIFNVVQHASLNHRLECEAGLMSEECGTMLRAFFQGRR